MTRHALALVCVRVCAHTDDLQDRLAFGDTALKYIQCAFVSTM